MDTRTAFLAETAVASPVGLLRLVASASGLVAILWENDRPRRVRVGPCVHDPEHPILAQTARELGDYFAGRRRRFDVPLAIVGTEFQQKVWSALRAIPYGETRSYRDLAMTIGHPTAFRAVGAANGRNPISIVVPCHRAIASDGRLIGFAGGLSAKTALLAIEQRGTRAPDGARVAALPNQ